MPGGLTARGVGRYSHRVPFRLVLFLTGAVCFAQQVKNPLAGDAAAIQSGQGVFRIYCGPCHGNQGRGGRGPDLTRGSYSVGDRDEDLFRTIAHGIPGTGMQGFDDLGEENTWRVVSFLRSIARHDAAGIPGDGAAGEKLFWGKGGCGSCHAVNGKGGRFGPSLSRIGRERSLEYLRESVVAPNNDVPADYATITLVKRDGTKIIGMGDLDNFSVRITDSAGNYYSFLRTDLASVNRELRSVMPDTYSRLFSPAELDDLLAYLASLRGAEAR
jgi:putative heme-binding domain-containing protein